MDKLFHSIVLKAENIFSKMWHWHFRQRENHIQSQKCLKPSNHQLGEVNASLYRSLVGYLSFSGYNLGCPLLLASCYPKHHIRFQFLCCIIFAAKVSVIQPYFTQASSKWIMYYNYCDDSCVSQTPPSTPLLVSQYSSYFWLTYFLILFPTKDLVSTEVMQVASYECPVTQRKSILVRHSLTRLDIYMPYN